MEGPSRVLLLLFITAGALFVHGLSNTIEVKDVKSPSDEAGQTPANPSTEHAYIRSLGHRHLLAALPGAPSIDNIGTVGDKAVLYVDVKPPADTGGLSITTFQVTGTPKGGVTAAKPLLTATGPGQKVDGSPCLRLTIATYPKGVLYRFKAKVASKAGYGPFSSPQTDFNTPKNGVPGVPGLALTRAGSTAYLDVTPPTNTGGVAASQLTYMLTGFPDGGNTVQRPNVVLTGTGVSITGQPGKRRFQIKGLLSNTVYRFTATAKNTIGSGPESSLRIMFYQCSSYFSDTTKGCKCAVSATGCLINNTDACSCKTCKNGYKMNGKGGCTQCITIKQCKTYAADCTCARCQSFFSGKACTCSVSATGCATKNTDNCSCKSCSNGFKAVGGGCSKCALIANCKTYSPVNCSCTACNQYFTLASNRTKCAAPTVLVRLTGSGRAAEGRLEVFRGGLWTAVAYSNNDSALAEVVCRQLGYMRSAWLRANVYWPQTKLPQWYSINCRGTEKTVLDCQFPSQPSYNTESVNIACGTASAPPRFSNAVRLVNGTGGAASSGRVELLRDGQWMPVRHYDSNRDGAAAAVVCRQLGFTGSKAPVAEAPQAFGPARSAPTLAQRHCGGSEVSLHNCICDDKSSNICARAETAAANGDALSVSCGTATSDRYFIRWLGSVAAATLVQDWDCQFTCRYHDLYAIDGGSDGQALCHVQTGGSSILGTWRSSTGACQVVDASLSLTTVAGEAYECLCRDADVPLGWSATVTCASGTAASITAAGVPPACRVQAGSTFLLGWFQASSSTCFLPDAAGGSHAVTGVGGTYKMQLLCKAACAACTDSVAGTRLVFAPGGKPYYQRPCASSPSPGRLAQCELFYFTGRKTASDCGEGMCYVEIDRGGQRFWVPDAGCGVVASTIGYPGNVNCPMPSCPCEGTPLAADDLGRRQVIWASAPTHATTCRSSAVLASTTKCQWVTYTGVKSPSSCGESWCYAQVKTSATDVGWVPLFNCEIDQTQDASLAKPAPGHTNTAACMEQPCSCMYHKLDAAPDNEFSTDSASQPSAAASALWMATAAESVVGDSAIKATRTLLALETFQPCKHCPSPGGFAFDRRIDYYSANVRDLFRCEKCSIAGLASLCLRIPQCGGFNTNGYLKSVAVDLRKEDKVAWPAGDLDPCAGSYLRTDFPATQHWALRIADPEFVTWGSNSVEIKGLLEVYWDTFAFGFGTTASWDSICVAAMSRRKAGLACTQLGFGSSYSDGSYFWETTRHAQQEARFEELTCPNTATMLKQCKPNDCVFNCCPPGKDTLLSCSIGLPEGSCPGSTCRTTGKLESSGSLGLYASNCNTATKLLNVPPCQSFEYLGIRPVLGICGQQLDGFNYIPVKYRGTAGWLQFKSGSDFACCPGCTSGSPSGSASAKPACETVQPTRQDIARLGWSLIGKDMWYIHAKNPDVSMLRWQGIRDKVCPDASVSQQTVPTYADCSSLVTWIYWTAFGKGTDYLNNKAWAEGFTGSMLSCPGSGYSNPYATPVAFTELQPGDVCIRGSDKVPNACNGEHVVMYLGKGDDGEDAFMSFGGPGYEGKPWKWWYHVVRRGTPDVSPAQGYSCRSFPDFFAGNTVNPPIGPSDNPNSGCTPITSDCFSFDEYCNMLKATEPLKLKRAYTCRQDDYDTLVTNRGADTGGIKNLRELAMLLANSQAEIEYGLGENGLRESNCFIAKYSESCKYGTATYTNYYCGRGFLQLTGCSNYKGAQQYLEQIGRYPGLNIVANPSALDTNRAASWDTAIWYWRACVRNDKSGAMPACLGERGFGSRSGALLDQGYFGVSTCAINGGECSMCGSINKCAAVLRFELYRLMHDQLKSVGKISQESVPSEGGCYCAINTVCKSHFTFTRTTFSGSSNMHMLHTADEAGMACPTSVQIGTKYCPWEPGFVNIDRSRVNSCA